MARERENLLAVLEDYRARISALECQASAERESAKLQDRLSCLHRGCAETLQSLADLADDRSHHSQHLQAAAAHYRASRALWEHLAQADPENRVWQRELGIAHMRLGEVLRRQGDLGAALVTYRAAIPIAERLTRAEPHRARLHLDLYFAHAGLATIEEQRGERQRALAAMRAAQAVLRRLTTLAPEDPNWPTYLDWVDTEIARLEG